MIDYAAMAKAATLATEKDSHKFVEGDTLIMLVASERAFPEGQGSLKLEVYGKKASVPNTKFGRSVVTYDQPLCQHPDFVAAYGEPVPSPCPIAEHVKTLDAKEKSDAKLGPIWLWVCCPLAIRPKGAKANSPWVETYIKPKWITAKLGGKSSHIQGELNELFDGIGLDKMRKIFDRQTAQLLVVTRKGNGFTDTSFTVRLADGEDPLFGDVSNWQVPDEINADINAATAVGGPCDLFTVAASAFSPRVAEIDRKLLGKGDANASE